MTREELVASVLARDPGGLTRKDRLALLVLAGVGLAGMLAGLVVGRPAWSVSALLVATLVITGLSQVGIVWSAVFEITSSRWGRSYRRLMELSLAAAPLALLLLVLLLATAGSWAPFARHSPDGFKGLWLSHPFWLVRNLVAVTGLFLLSGWYLVHCLRPDLGLAKERGRPFPGFLTSWLTRHWRGSEAEVARSSRLRGIMAPVICIAYALVYSMVGFDLVMAMDPDWYSTLFGAYFFTGNVYMGLALAILLALVFRHRVGSEGFFSAKHFGLMGTLLFAFCFLMGDFFWSQFLTIWYGNLPEEVGYLIHRTLDPEFPWRYLAWAVLAGFFVVPFCTLMFRAVKWAPARVSTIAVVVLVSMIAERFLTAAPTLLHLEPGATLAEMALPLGLAILASLGMLAAGGLLYGWMMRQVPLLPISDPLLMDSLKDSQERR